jgi:hypothetical protein
MEERVALVREISRRLFISLVVLLAIAGGLLAASRYIKGFVASDPLLTIIIGAVGGFVGLQRRLKQLSEDDLVLIRTSWVYTILAPLVGGILALLLYILFMSGLLAGDLFPKFQLDTDPDHSESLFIIFDTHGQYQDYAKLVFWCFLAGYSERFVIDIISQFEKKATHGK